MARTIQRAGVLTVPICVDCLHCGEDGFCEKVRASQSFARQNRDRFACGPWGNLFEAVCHTNQEPKA